MRALPCGRNINYTQLAAGHVFKMEFQSAVINRMVKNINKNNNGLYTCASFDPSIIVYYFHLDTTIYFVIVQHYNLVRRAQINM